MTSIRQFVKNRKTLRLIAKFMRNSYRLSKTLIGREKTIKQMNIEMAAKCNARCKYCALHIVDQKYFNVDMLKEMLDDLLKNGYDVQRLHLTGGDGLQHPELERLLSVIKEYKDNGGESYVFISTNAILLNERTSNILVNSKAIDMIQCSVDGYDRESFEELRPPAKFDNIVKNIEYLLELEGRPTVTIFNGNTEDKKEYADYYQDLLDKVDSYAEYTYHDWGGQLDIKSDKKIPKGFCYLAFGQFYVLSNGKVTKCCWDLNGKAIYGDVNEHSIVDIFRSRRRKVDLLKMFFGLRSKVPGCNECELGVD